MFQATCYVLVFFACVLVLAKVRAVGLRQAVLLIGSYAVYLTWTRWFIAILAVSVLMNFFIGKWLRRNPSWLPLWVGIIFNLALLAVFKYAPDLAVNSSLPIPHSLSHLALPIGISFWTFQALSYLFDLYREEELDPSFAEFALYMAFFPVTISGPVCRLPEMLPQFRSEQTTRWNEIGQGLRRIAIGVLMMQVARLLGQGILGGDGIVSGFDRVTQWSGADVWCLAFGYGLQLFFDFAGYSHIAIGAAKALGFTVPENFERPFESTTPSVFWTRWHMSLSFWIRDYVFLPLATARRGMWWRNLALILSMILFGFWHRASLLFLIWGCYHGVLLVLHRQIQQFARRLDWQPAVRLWAVLSWLVTISLISLGWIFFRSNSWGQARGMLSAVASPATYASHLLTLNLYVLVAAVADGYAIVLLTAEAIVRHATPSVSAASPGALASLARWRWFWIPSLYVLALFLLLMVTHSQDGGAGQLMYRRF